MLNFRCLRNGIALACVLATVCCTGVRDSGTPTFLIPVLDQNGVEHFAYVQLKTLSSPYRMEGAAARVYFNPNAVGNSLQGDVAEPRYNRSGSTLVPADTASGSVVATYAFYEHQMFYEKRVLLSSSITWPRIVGVYRDVTNLPPGNESNASYLNSPADETIIMPFGDNGKVALTFNCGVLAHEHLHAHFDALVLRNFTGFSKASQEDGIGILGCAETDLGYGMKLVRSWNEGLADFYGAVTCEQPNFILSSLAMKKRMVGSSPRAMRARSCQTADDVDPYFNGTQLARALYVVAAHDEFPALEADAAQLSKWERSARYIIYRLGAFQTALSAQNNWSKVPPEFALCFFLKGVTLSNETTAIVNKAFSSSFPNGVSQCASM